MGIINAKMKAAQWPKGTSGNPAGQQKRNTMEQLVHTELDRVVPEKIRKLLDIADGQEKDLTYRTAIARVFVGQMVGGNENATRLFFARDWPEIKHHELTGPDGRPLAEGSTSAFDFVTGQLAELLESEGDSDEGGTRGDAERPPGTVVQ